MNRRVASGCVTVTGPPRSICSRNRGITLPLLSSTFPKRTVHRRVPPPFCRPCTASSAMRLVIPITLTGSTALSVEISTKCPAP